jgi:hypothetical protein
MPSLVNTFAVGVAAFCLVGSSVSAGVLFDFENAPLHASLPLDLTVGGITAHFSATGQGFSIQDTQQVILVLPAGFSGQGIVPNGISPSDLLIGFSQPLSDFSILVAPQDLNTDSSATMSVTAYLDSTLVGTNTVVPPASGIWPSAALTFASAQPFNNVVIHWALPPPTGGDYGPIFVADNVIVTAAVPGPVLSGAASRKTHGAAGTFDLPLTITATGTVNHAPAIEPRQGPDQTVVFNFDKPITGATATVTEGTATVGTLSFDGNNVVVPLTGVSNQQYVTVTLTSVASSDGGTGGNGEARIGFLLGDVNGTRAVSVADLGLVNQQLAQLVTAANFMKDVNVSGTLTLADKGITNANLTRALPAP